MHPPCSSCSLSYDFKTYLIRNMFIYPLWSPCSTSSNFSHISIKEYTHMSSLELLVYFHKILRQYLIRSILRYLIWSTGSTSSSFQHIFNKEYTRYPPWRSCSTSVRFSDISNMEYTHISALEPMVSYLKLVTHV